MSVPPRLSCLLIGESNLLFRCADILVERGHMISAVTTQEGGATNGHKTHRDLAEARAVLPARPDVIFSIVNRTILRSEDIAWAKLAGINYHDSPLPAYAGVNAPSWAILNGEAEHGVTWHLLTERVDAGDILAQKTFPVSEDDTALSLSAKCFEHALSTFGELLDNLEAGNLRGRKQDLSKRTVSGRTRRLPRQGIIDWTDSAPNVCRFVRAGQLGAYANDFGLPKILLPDGGLVVVGKATTLSPAVPRSVGTVVDADIHSLRVVAGDGRLVRLEQLALLDGRNLASPPLLKGSKLPTLSESETESILAVTISAAKIEEDVVASLRKLPMPVIAPGMRRYKYNATGEHVSSLEVKHDATPGEIFAPICKRLLRENGGRPFTIGIAQQVPHGFMPVRPVVCHDVETSTLATFIDQEIAASPIPADLPTRFPELHHSLLRMGAIAVCLAVRESTPLTNPGLIAQFNGGRLTLRFDAGQVSKEDAGAVADFLLGSNPETTRPQAETAPFVTQRISRWAAMSPDAVAIESAGQTLSYGDLERRSNALASKLHDCGAAKEVLIAVLLPQGCDFVVSTVAVLKSGAAYLPLEISTPLYRLRDIVRDARPLAVITDHNHMDLALQLGVAIVRADDGVMAVQPTSCATTQGDDLAYVIYTSGSTGEPKGSMIEHGALETFIAADIERNNIVPGDRVLQLCSIAFDASVEEIFSAICSGATLVIRPQTLLDSADTFLDFCERERLTIIGIYSSMLGDILAAMERRGRFPETVRLATTGGEMVSAADAERWRRFFDEKSQQPPTFLNVYGLTETTVANCTSDLSRPPDLPGQVPIGKPLPGNRVRVVDSQLADVAPGQVGELLIAGPQLARAYWNRPAINAERFFQDQLDGTRWFRTGDLVRMSPGDNLYFDGRIDRQVKVSGVRIELEDIERAIQSHPEVTHAAAILHRSAGGRELLTGFFTTLKEGLEESLRQHLEQRLPASMHPRRLVPLDTFPINDRGKTDYAELGAILDREFVGNEQTVNEDQDVVLRVWKEFFPWSDAESEEESFFNLGGDSLTALRLLLRAEQETGTHLPVSSFYREPSLAGLRRMLSTGKSDDTFEPLLPLRIEGNATPIYFLHGGDGDVVAYSALVEKLDPDRPVFGVRSAAVLRGRELPRTFEQAAADAVATITKHRPQGPWILVGWSWAGTLAYETAVQLHAQTGVRPVVIMIDALAPLTRFTTTERTVHFVRRFPRWFLRSWLGARLLRCARHAILRLPPETRTSLRRFISGKAQKIPPSVSRSALGVKIARAGEDIISRLQHPRPRNFPESRFDPTEHHFGLARSYTPRRKTGLEIHLIRAAKHAIPPFHPDIHFGWRDNGWRRATGCEVHPHLIRSCNHNELLREPKCQQVAHLIGKISDANARSG